MHGLVSSHATLDEIYDTVRSGARGLLGVDCGSLRFVDPEDPTWSVAMATRGVAGSEPWRERSPISEGISGCVISTGRVVGSLLVGTTSPGRRWTEPERRLLGE